MNLPEPARLAIATLPWTMSQYISVLKERVVLYLSHLSWLGLETLSKPFQPRRQLTLTS
jgi:hypothetical protein